MRRLLPLLAVPALLVACGSDEEPATACEARVEEAAAIDDMADAVTDLDPALAECATLAEFIAATEAHPGALDGVDPALFISNRCSAGVSSPLCP